MAYVKEAIPLGGVVAIVLDDEGRTVIELADPRQPIQHPIGIATEDIPLGALIEWDWAKLTGTYNGRRVIVAKQLRLPVPRRDTIQPK